MNVAIDNEVLRYRLTMWGVALMSVVLFVALIFFGTVDIEAREVWYALTGEGNDAVGIVVLDLRLPMAAGAFIAGMGLAVAGLLLQTTFSNPLAGPSILGVSTGASLGVAIVLLLLGGGAGTGLGHYAGTLIGAVGGAAAMLVLLLLFAGIVRGTAMLLIVGVLLGYLASSAISILNFYATAEGVHSFVIWGLGSFSGVSVSDMAVFGPLVLLAVGGSMLMIKPLDAMLLGDEYAESMGVNLHATRNWLLLLSGLLTAGVTAFCGPIGFLGLVIPHVARLTQRSSLHSRLLPATALWGGFSGLLCAAISVFAGRGSVLPVNAITPVLSIPVIIYVIVNRDKLSYFR